MEERLLLFPDRAAFRAWLMENVEGPGGWLVFGKKGGPKTVSAAQALEEALCFGWIDGQMESLGEDRYKKYFSPRRRESKWSDKNRKLVEKLEAEGLMTDHGRRAIDVAKKRGTWESEPRTGPTPEQLEAVRTALRAHEKAYANFINMTPSVQRTYTLFALDVKTEAGREKRLAQLIERLELNLNPMESLKKKKDGP